MQLRSFLSVVFGAVALAGPVLASPVMSDYMIYGTQSVTIGSNVRSYSGGAIASGGDIIIGSGVGYKGGILSGGSTQVGSNAQIDASIHAGGNVTIGNGAWVSGTTAAAGTAQAGKNAVVGPVLSGQARPVLPTAPVQSDFTASGGENLATRSGTHYNLASGSYGNFVTGTNTTLTLSSGSYYFNDLTFGQNTYINLDLGLGAIIINVAGDLSGGNHLIFAMSPGGSASDIFYDVQGSATFGSGSHFAGAIFAGDDISFGNNVTITGALYGNNVRVGNGSELLMAGSNILPINYEQIGGPISQEISAPGAVGFLGLGLLGLVMWRRRQA